MADTYNANFSCSNCRWEGVLLIEKGTTKKDAADNTECPNCGCDTIFPLN